MKRAVHLNGRPIHPLLLGLAGGLLGSFAMNAFGRAVIARGNGREADGAAPGGDRTGRGVQPPQAEGTADQDATVRAGSMAYRAVTGEEPGRPAKRWLGSAAHYGFGGTVGAAYALAAERAPVVRAGYGLLFGGLVWAIADEGIIPALGLSRGPGRLRPGVHAYALLGHFVYAATVESVVRLARLPTPNAQHPTPNTQRPTPKSILTEAQ